jgi:hypothetical protein
MCDILKTSNKVTRNSQIKLDLGCTVPYGVHAAARNSEQSEPGSNNSILVTLQT